MKTKTASIVKVSLPGVQPEDVNLTLLDNVLTIEGESKAEDAKEDVRYHVRGRRWGTFSPQVALPTTVDPNGVQTGFKDGILTLTLPKAEEAKPKHITIRAGAHDGHDGHGQTQA